MLPLIFSVLSHVDSDEMSCQCAYADTVLGESNLCLASLLYVWLVSAALRLA